VNRIPVWVQAALVAAIVVVIHLSLVPMVGDLDSFYHWGHAAGYLEGSIFDTSLPWATQSIIADRGADLWWGFHLLLAPVTLFGNPATGIWIAAILMTLALVACVWFVFARHSIDAPAIWVVVFLLAVPNVLFRYLMVRPHVLSLGMSLVLLSLLAKGRWWQVGLAALAITWLHISLFWMPFGLLAAYALSRLFARSDEGVPLLAAIPSVIGGVAVGWLLRPHPLATLELAWIQIGELFALKGADTPLLFAGELLPLPIEELVVTSWLFLAVWIVCGVASVRLWARDRLAALPGHARSLLVASSAVSGVFLCLTLAAARRGQVEWVAFGIMSAPLLWTFTVPAAGRRRMLAAALALLAVHLPWSVHRHRLNVQYAAFPANALAVPAEWLELNTPPGDIVFHARWDNFGPLVAHNRANRYLSGMDPIFQFLHDPKLYWEFFWLSADIHSDWTCDAFPCHEGTATDTHEVLREHFNARWVLVEPRRNPKLTLYLIEDPRFLMVLETPREAVFQVLDGSADLRGNADIRGSADLRGNADIRGSADARESAVGAGEDPT
jgi:hypothetical protein